MRQAIRTVEEPGSARVEPAQDRWCDGAAWFDVQEQELVEAWKGWKLGYEWHLLGIWSVAGNVDTGPFYTTFTG